MIKFAFNVLKLYYYAYVKYKKPNGFSVLFKPFVQVILKINYLVRPHSY